MCGICGVISKEPLRELGPVRKMQKALAHRGPNGQGEYSSQHIGLAMRRLSIIDVEGGDQPLYNEDCSLVLVANGEIYNFIELRGWLQSKGHRFHTGSDCETILHLYEEYGPRCVEYLRGMFAFALWDSRREELLVARDRMGEKPLYLYQTEEKLMFASELKSLLSTGEVPLELDPVAVDLYFHYQFVPEPRTPIAGVRKLPPACLLSLDVTDWDLRERRYWRFDEAPLLTGDPVVTIRDELETVGGLISRSDVPIGVALSGGIDSSAVAALLAKNSEKPVAAFSVGYKGRPANDERGEARQMAESLGMDFHDIELDEHDVIERFPELVGAWDDPIADMSGFCYHAISRLVHEQGIRVLVQGQGGDELFWGYPWVRRAMAASLRKTALWEKGWLALPNYVMSDLASGTSPMEDAEPLPFGAAKMGEALKQFREDRRAPRGRLTFYDLHPDFEAARTSMKDLYTEDFRSLLDSRAPFAPFTVSLPREHLTVDLTRLISQTYLLENGIVQGDRLSMANSVELRLPLVDYRLVEKIVGLRKNYPDHLQPPKTWLREAVRELLPESVVTRKKRPFEAPLQRWHSRLFDEYGHLLEDGYLVQSGVLRPQAARHLAEGHFPEGAGSTLAFKALVLELWCQTVLSPERDIACVDRTTNSARR